ncbi:MAG: hypothetical protein JST86_01400 [Bacteroidetes bacterium]|nr:hypothetical protein [Bacteroidota bacterium]
MRLVFISLIFCCTAAAAQTKTIDSLRRLIQESTVDSVKLKNIFALNDQAINADSILPYIIIAEKITAASKNQEDADLVAFCRCSYYTRKNFIDSAELIIDPLVSKYKNDPQHAHRYLTFLFFRSKIFDRGNQYTKTISSLAQVIQLAEDQHDTATQIQATTGIGWVQMEMGQYKEALKWLYKAMYKSPDKKFYKNYGALYSNIASAYNSLGNGDSAQHYIEIAINDARQNENLLFLATALSIQAKIFIDNKKTSQAEAPLIEALAIRKKLSDPFYIVYDMNTLASYYANNNQTAKGIQLCQEGIVLAKESGLSSQLLMIYKTLAENYKAIGREDMYSKTLEAIIILKDSFNNINSSKLIADIQANNQAREKQKEILEQKLKLTQKNYWLIGSGIFGIMLTLIALLAFYHYRTREKMKLKMILDEEQRKAADAVKTAEEKQRLRIAADLHDNLGVYAASMASNLGYLRIPKEDERSAHAMVELQNNSNAMISQLNDTIWVLKKEALYLTAISDRVKNFINRIKKSYPEVNFYVDEKIDDDVMMSSSQAFNLYYVIQEAVNNALKHSKGSTIGVEITGGEHWVVIIRDNGTGFIPDSAGETGNGIQNMKNRCMESGWFITWSSQPGNGTVVNISHSAN